MNILIVEDAKDQRKMLSVVLKKQGYRIFEAEHGIDALKCLHEQPDIRIVISDWMMPEMDGLELCKALRQQDFGRYIYFILLTSKTESKSLVEGITCGADDFVTKPVNINAVLARLKAGVRIIKLERDLEEKNKALSNAMAIVEKDLESAAQTQAGLLVKPGLINNVQCDWFFKPCKHLGGDMFGVHAMDKEHLSFYQLDVAGHGVPSSLFSFTLNHLLSETGERAFINEKSSQSASGYSLLSPETVLARLNERFQTTAEKMFYFTIVYGTMNNLTGEVVLSQAGHPNPLWMKKSTKSLDVIQGSGVPIGMVEDQQYSTASFILEPGDRLFLYSDGLTECDNGGDQFGFDRLSQTLETLFDRSLETVILQVQEEIKRWTQSNVFEDDITYLILEWNP